MWANSVWGFLGISISCAVTAIGLSPQYLWLRPFFVSAAGVSFFSSLALLIWPAFRRSNRSRTVSDIDLPDILLLPPKRSYTLVWDPPNSMQIVLWPDPTYNEPDQTSGLFPAFHIKNLGNAVAHEITIDWDIENQDFNSTVTQSPLVQEFFGVIASNYFTVWSQADQRSACMWSERFGHRGSNKITYLAPSIDNISSLEILLPHDLSSWIDIYFAAKLAAVPMLGGETLSMTAKISWLRPAAKPVFFKILVKAVSIRSPNALVKMAESDQYRPEPRIKSRVTFAVERV